MKKLALCPLPTLRSGMVASGLLFLSDSGYGKADDFYAQDGSGPTFEDVMESGDLPHGRNSTNGFKGSKITLNHELLEQGPNAHRPLLEDIKIHTLGNSVIPRSSSSKWSRWYQEDGNPNIFRLFKGEENVRNTRNQSARIEAFSDLRWTRGDWQEWVGTYTITKPHRCAIFQAKNNKNDWSVHLNMTDDGDVILNHRQAEDKMIARNMTGKPFHIRIRDNGHDYEVYLNGRKEGEGEWARPTGESSPRWGMYLGAFDLRHQAMLLIKACGSDIAEEESLTPEPVPEPEKGLMIPSRTWTNKDSRSITAADVYQLGGDFVKLKARDRWVQYSLGDLSYEDRSALAKATEAADSGE